MPEPEPNVTEKIKGSEPLEVTSENAEAYVATILSSIYLTKSELAKESGDRSQRVRFKRMEAAADYDVEKFEVKGIDVRLPYTERLLYLCSERGENLSEIAADEKMLQEVKSFYASQKLASP